MDNGSEDFHANSMRRLDRMEAVIHSMIDAMQEQSKVWTKQHEENMAEIRESRAEIQELITLQKEHRIDIMALFEGSKGIREQSANVDKLVAEIREITKRLPPKAE